MSIPKLFLEDLERACQYSDIHNLSQAKLNKFIEDYHITLPNEITTKTAFCKFVADEVIMLNLIDSTEKALLTCQGLLKDFQSTANLNYIGEKASGKLLPILTQQLLWLSDRQHELHGVIMGNKNTKQKISLIISLINTIEGQCRNAQTILKKFSIKPVVKSRFLGLFSPKVSTQEFATRI